MFKNLVSFPKRAVTKTRLVVASVATVVAAALVAVLPVAALATESETETKLHEVTTQVGSEGVAIVLAILGGLVALIAAIIIIPKGIGMIKRFI